MINKKIKFCAVAIIFTLAIPLAAQAKTKGSLSYGSMTADAKLTPVWTSNYDKARGKTTFTSDHSINSGYVVTVFAQAADSSRNELDSAFDTGEYWAEANAEGANATYLNSTNTISDANHIYDHVDIESLSAS